MNCKRTAKKTAREKDKEKEQHIYEKKTGAVEKQKGPIRTGT